MLAPTYAPTGVVRGGSRLTGMTEEKAPVTGRRCTALGRAPIPKRQRARWAPKGL